MRNRTLVIAGAGIVTGIALTVPVSTQRAAAPPLVITAYNDGAPIPYTVPRTPWGDPDLQGVWSSDDTAGIPRERPRQSRQPALSDRRGVGGAAETGVGRRPSRRERRGLVPQRLRHARFPPDLAHRRSARRPAAGGDARSREAARIARPRHLRQRALQHLRGLHALRPLHHPRHRRLGAPRHLRQRQPHRAGAGHGGVQLRDDPRHARLLHRRATASLPEHPAVSRRLAGPVGRRRAGGRDDQSHRQDEHRRQRQRAAPQRPDGDHRALHAAWPTTSSSTSSRWTTPSPTRRRSRCRCRSRRSRGA